MILVRPHASSIDTELPVPSEDRVFDEYPDESLAEWHERHGLTK